MTGRSFVISYRSYYFISLNQKNIFIVIGELLEDVKNHLNVVPVRFEMKGNYGVAIHWSDGHFADIFPFTVLRKIVQQNSAK